MKEVGMWLLTAGGLLLAAVAFFLWIPIRFHLTYNSQEGGRLTGSIAGRIISIWGARPGEESALPWSKVMMRIRSWRPDQESGRMRMSGRRMYRLVTPWLRSFWGYLGAHRQAIRVQRLHWKIHIGGRDAMETALAIGAAWTVVLNLWRVARSRCDAHQGDVNFQIKPDFAGLRWQMEVDCIATFRIGYIIHAGLWHVSHRRGMERKGSDVANESSNRRSDAYRNGEYQRDGRREYRRGGRGPRTRREFDYSRFPRGLRVRRRGNGIRAGEPDNRRNRSGLWRR
ncbi:hypothetical protein M2243_001781 [Heliophilum fasciatum]|nr:hypothetical protein [Heliophilum fasciatum]